MEERSEQFGVNASQAVEPELAEMTGLARQIGSPGACGFAHILTRRAVQFETGRGRGNKLENGHCVWLAGMCRETTGKNSCLWIVWVLTPPSCCCLRPCWLTSGAIKGKKVKRIACTNSDAPARARGTVVESPALWLGHGPWSLCAPPTFGEPLAACVRVVVVGWRMRRPIISILSISTSSSTPPPCGPNFGPPARLPNIHRGTRTRYSANATRPKCRAETWKLTMLEISGLASCNQPPIFNTPPWRRAGHVPGNHPTVAELSGLKALIANTLVAICLFQVETFPPPPPPLRPHHCLGRGRFRSA